MAARYVRIGQHPDYRDEIRGTLAEILASTANPGTYAAPEDVTGTYLEMGADGLWTGASLGTLTQAQADALVASGALGKVKIGTPAEIDGKHARWTGTAWQSDLIVGPFADIPAANAWAAANPSSLFPGLLATTAGVQYKWGGVEVGWVAAYGEAVGTPYVGGVKPAGYIGEEIQIDNPAVPGGRSKLRWSRAVADYVPPAGELIAQYSSPTYLAQATPGVQSLYKAWQSPDIIPDYMIPDGGAFTISAAANIKNTAGAAGCHLMCGVSGNDPTNTEASFYAIGIRSFTPSIDGTGLIPAISGFQQRVGVSSYRSTRWGANPTDLSGCATRSMVVTSDPAAMIFSPGSNRIYVKAVTKSASDVVTVNMVQIKAGF